MKKTKSYVMFGFNKDDIDTVGYFGKNNNIVSDVEDARIFIEKFGRKPKKYDHRKTGQI